jgi:hypothetical protein
MKKSFFILVALIVALTVNAENITREQAQQRAKEYLSSLSGARQNLRLVPVRNRAKLAPRRDASSSQPEQELYYVFNRGEGEGFVIASADDSTYPVLGYTSEGDFDYTQLPPNMKWWLGWITSQLEDLAANPVPAAKRAPKNAPTHPAIAAMVTTRWNQGAPYNDECPKHKSGERCVTGCVATAMAQLLYFQRAKSVTETQKDMPAYETNGIQVPGVPAGSTIDWDNMIDNYGGSSTAKQRKAVAELMRYCGVGLNMMYGISSEGGSAAYSYKVVDALKDYFGYGNSVKLINTDNPGTDAWDKTLYNELEHGRPFYLSGHNADGGHAFVCDGYDGNQCFHINWGWGGSSDGNYMLSKLNPGSQGIGGSSGGYSDGPEAVIGIEPENYATKAMPISNATLKKICYENFDKDGDGVLSFGEAAEVTDLGDVFKGQNFNSFPELYNFTGLKTLNEGAFEGCTRLATIKLPKHLKVIGARAFKGCSALKPFVLPEEITAIGDEAFDGCKVFTASLPNTLTEIGARAFQNCQALKEVVIPLGLKSLGAGAFAGCTKLTDVTLRSIKPQAINLGEGVFADVNLESATLNVIQGFKAELSTADQWKDFGNIYELRDLSRGQFATIAMEKKFFLYNVGTGRYLTRGEAWGTQAVVSDTDNPMCFEFKKTAAMPDGVYYLYSEDTGNDNHILFRTSNDDNVGKGVKACFVDGPTSKNGTKESWWNIALVEGEENIYTLQVPSNVSGYVATQYFGYQSDHASDAASPTYGAYSDIIYSENPGGCQWMLVEYDEEAAAIFRAANQLGNLLTIATGKRLDVTPQQAVYDNLNSSLEDLERCQRQLRKRMGFVLFASDVVRQALLANGFDSNGDGEISTTEADQAQYLEASVFSGSKDVTTMSDLQHFTGLQYITGQCFKNCTNLKDIIIPNGPYGIFYYAFQNCTSLTAIEIPASIEFLGYGAFAGCSSLVEVKVHAADPSFITVDENPFDELDLSKITLYVPHGSVEAYKAAPYWQDFGNIVEHRARQRAGFSELATNSDIYVYNLGQRQYITSGEAYGTQAVVDRKGIIYQLRRSANMPEDTYYLYATSSSTNNILFRTDTDSKVGKGVKACFVDGSVSSKAYWHVAPVEGLENVYTFQVPDNQKDFVDGEYLGINLDHESDYAGFYYTYGLYYDIPYDGNEENCQWAFISKAEVDSLNAFYDLTQELKQLIQKADERGFDTTAEKAVYDNFDSTEPQIQDAIVSLQTKLHYIAFTDSKAKSICTNNWDDDEDGELTYEEAAAVTDIGTVFHSAAALTTLDELRYFTSLTNIPDEAFRNSSTLYSIYLPETVTSIGKNAFTGCSALTYIAAMNQQQVLDPTDAGLTLRNITLFTPASQVEAYQANEAWERSAIKEFTGVPVVTADSLSRQYGRTNPKFTYDVTGAPVNGVPEFVVDAENTTPVGDYPIIVKAGSITTKGVEFKHGILTVEPALLTITAKSYTRNIGEANPEFEVTYPSFRNREKAEEVLLHEAVCECDATPESPAGEYEIRVSGAEAQNYVFEYVNGTLTIIDPVGVRDVKSKSSNGQLYDLSGRPIRSTSRGIYITEGKKITVK